MHFTYVARKSFKPAIMTTLSPNDTQSSSSSSPTTGQLDLDTLLVDYYEQFQAQFESQSLNFNIDVNTNKLLVYENPKIEIRISRECGGRGLIANQNIKQGEYILIEKALVYSSTIMDNQSCNELFIKMNKEKNSKIDNQNNDEMIFDETVLLMKRMIVEIENDTDGELFDNKLLSNFYPRSSHISKMDEFKCSDFGINDECDQWLFNYCLLKMFQLRFINKCELISNEFILRLPYIVYCNAMKITQNTEQLSYFQPNTVQSENENNAVSFADMTADGIFANGSFLNHSCSPNCCHSFIGDILIVKAICDIKSEEQITISYLEIENLCENQKFRSRRLPFDCQCLKCTKEMSIQTISNLVENETDDEYQIFDDSLSAELFAEKCSVRLKRIDSIFAMNNVQNMKYSDFISGQTALAFTYCEMHDFVEGMACFRKCLDAIQNMFGSVHETMVPFYLQIVLCQMSINLLDFQENGEDQKQEQIGKVTSDKELELDDILCKMFDVHHICFGGGRILFLKRYENEIKCARYYPSVLTQMHTWNRIALNKNNTINIKQQ